MLPLRIVGTIVASALSVGAPVEASPVPSTSSRVVVIGPDMSATSRAGLATNLTEALADQIRQAQLEVAVSRDAGCDAPECRAEQSSLRQAAFVVTLTIEVEDRDYTTRVELFDAATDEMLASNAQTCSICGVQEVLDLVGDQGSTLAKKVRMVSITAPISIESEPSGAQVTIDGVVVGVTPYRARMDAGEHEVALSLSGHTRVRRTFHATAGLAQTVTVTLPVSAAMPRLASPRIDPPVVETKMPVVQRRMRIAGGTLLGTGVLALGAFVPLLVLDDTPVQSRCEGLDRDFLGNCRYVHDTRGGAIALGVAGSVALLAGATLIGIAVARARRRRKGR